MKNYGKTYTALITPMKKSGEIDYKSLKQLIKFQIESGVTGIVLLGTTGEEPTIDFYEKHKMIKIAEQLTKNKIELIVGVSSNDTQRAINEVQGLSGYNISSFLLGTPYYNKPTATGLYKHFKKIADSSYKPIILYNVPSRTGINIPLSVIEKLRTHPKIIGIKEASGDFNYASKLARLISHDFIMLSGNDNMTLPLMSLGAIGSISVLSNFMPKQIKSQIDSFTKNDNKKALSIHNYLLDIINACFFETNPIPVKYIMNKLGLCKNKLREPLQNISAKNRTKVNKILQNYILNGDFESCAE